MEIPANISFEQAISLTQTLMGQMATGEIGDKELQASISQLVSTMNGARGFFVTYLTHEHPLADDPSPAVVQGLLAAPETISALLVKNLAMSTAMAIAHRRQQNSEMATQSEQVAQRTAKLVKKLGLPAVDIEAQHLWQSVSTNAGTYTTFLDRWGYDQEQRQAIQAALSQTFTHLAIAD